MKYLKHLFIVMLLLSFTQVKSQTNTLVDGVVATVGDNIILKSDIDRQAQQYQAQGIQVTDANKCEILENLLYEKLLVNQAELDSVVVTQDEVEDNINNRLKQLSLQVGGEEKLEQIYNKSIFELKEQMRTFMRDQMLAQRMEQQVSDGIEVSPAEVRKFYNNFKKDSLPVIPKEYEIAQILIYPEISDLAKKEAKDKLNGLRERIKNGSSFSTMAILYSEDPGSSKNGGEYKGVQRGQMVKEFERVIYRLKEGEVSEIFETQFGYHIAQLIKKRGQLLDIRHILIKPDIYPTDLEETKAIMDSIKVSILNGTMTFADAAAKFSDDDASKLSGGVMRNPQNGNPYFEVEQMDKQLFYSVSTLTKGQLSDSELVITSEGKQAYRIIFLKNVTEEHKADLGRDYQRIQQIALLDKKERLRQEWIEEHAKNTYIRINENYFKCELRNNWEQN